MAKNELIMMALTRASYYNGGSVEEIVDGDGRGLSSGDLVKMALKNLVNTM